MQSKYIKGIKPGKALEGINQSNFMRDIYKVPATPQFNLGISKALKYKPPTLPFKKAYYTLKPLEVDKKIETKLDKITPTVKTNLFMTWKIPKPTLMQPIQKTPFEKFLEDYSKYIEGDPFAFLTERIATKPEKQKTYVTWKGFGYFLTDEQKNWFFRLIAAGYSPQEAYDYAIKAEPEYITKGVTYKIPVELFNETKKLLEQAFADYTPNRFYDTIYPRSFDAGVSLVLNYYKDKFPPEEFSKIKRDFATIMYIKHLNMLNKVKELADKGIFASDGTISYDDIQFINFKDVETNFLNAQQKTQLLWQNIIKGISELRNSQPIVSGFGKFIGSFGTLLEYLQAASIIYSAIMKSIYQHKLEKYSEKQIRVTRGDGSLANYEELSSPSRDALKFIAKFFEKANDPEIKKYSDPKELYNLYKEAYKISRYNFLVKRYNEVVDILNDLLRPDYEEYKATLDDIKKYGYKLH